MKTVSTNETNFNEFLGISAKTESANFISLKELTTKQRIRKTNEELH